MIRLRHALLIALALLVSTPIVTRAEPQITALDPIGIGQSDLIPPGGSSDSGEPDIGQGGKGCQGQNIEPQLAPLSFEEIVRWARAIWSTRYLGIGF
jgi:hypothetical protein